MGSAGPCGSSFAAAGEHVSKQAMAVCMVSVRLLAAHGGMPRWGLRHEGAHAACFLPVPCGTLMIWVHVWV